MKLTIFHFGDSHWVPKYEDPRSRKGDRPTQMQSDIYLEYLESLSKIPFASYNSPGEHDHTVVVHTGDFANFYPEDQNLPELSCRHIPIAEQFKDIAARHIKWFEDTFDRREWRVKFVAVPGNHDLSKHDRSRKLQNKFRHFRKALPRWITPVPSNKGVSTPHLRIPIDGCPDHKIAFFLFNSSQRVWATTDGHKRPNAVVPREDFPKIHSSDYFKIAVLHHNILPQYGQFEKTQRNDTFINN